MNRRAFLSTLAAAGTALGQEEFVCPMDPDVRSWKPGVCPRCGMKLVAGIPDGREFRVSIHSKPALLQAGVDAELSLRVEDPRNPEAALRFEPMHEKLYHLFVVSQDLEYFAHIHPELQSDSTFQVAVQLPRAGMYRVLSDFYPKGATPQLIANTLMAGGHGFRLSDAAPQADVAPKTSRNLTVELVTEPAEPVAGFKTRLFFRLSPKEGIEPYLGAMGHMLAVSADLIDMSHAHPIYDTESGRARQLQFNMIFPRAGVYRVWVQFQRAGIVNTVAFNIPVRGLDS